ncbi:MAG: hypothetical protein WBZ48_04470 [Bacteroidota bacterium]
MKRSPGIVVLLFSCASVLTAQLQVSGQASAGFLKANDGESQYAFNEGKGTFVWRLDLFSDAIVTDNITFLSNFRMLQDQIPHIDLLAIRASDIGETGISLQAGQIDIPFGNLGEQRFPKQNPFFDLPLINEHITTLCESDYKVWTLIPEYQIAGNGVALLDQGLYDLGVKAYGSIGIFDYSFAFINGMVSTTGTYSPNGLDSHHGFGKVLRLAATPIAELTIGVSYAAGPFMKDQSESIDLSGNTPDTSAFFGKSPDNYLQKIAEGDVSFSLGHFLFDGEVIGNSWQYLKNIELKAFGYSAMVQYAFTPRFSGALRAGGISFNNVSGLSELTESFQHITYSGKWDHDEFRLEEAISYKFDPALLLKIGYQINRTYDLPKDPVDNVFFAQTVVNF